MSTAADLHLAVVGHTNAGKTSILRTLSRDPGFGEVSISPATTRAIEPLRLDLGAGLALTLVDTPGFEDSMGLLDALHAVDGNPRLPGRERIQRFLDCPAAAGFGAEADALAEILAADLSLYVVDAREPPGGKYQDEFVILAWSGRPVLVVLNFVAAASADAAGWRERLQQAGLHNVVAFDSVVFDPRDEERLLRQVALLLPAAEGHCERLVELRASERQRQREAAAALIAEALLDFAGLHAGDDTTGIEQQVQDRERRLNHDLLAQFGFDDTAFAPDDLPIRGVEWTLDPFDTTLLSDLGLSLGSAAAKGAAAGAAIDLVTGFTSLGTASLIGGAVGAGLDGSNRLRRWLAASGEDTHGQHVPPQTLAFLARRACVLVQSLARRGHAATTALTRPDGLDSPLVHEAEVLRLLARHRFRPDWLRRTDSGQRERDATVLAGLLMDNLAAGA